MIRAAAGNKREASGPRSGTAKLTNIVPLVPNFPKTITLSFPLNSIPIGERERANKREREREIKVAANEVARNFDQPANN